jgi:hypothetical protein
LYSICSFLVVVNDLKWQETEKLIKYKKKKIWIVICFLYDEKKEMFKDIYLFITCIFKDSEWCNTFISLTKMIFGIFKKSSVRHLFFSVYKNIWEALNGKSREWKYSNIEQLKRNETNLVYLYVNEWWIKYQHDWN